MTFKKYLKKAGYNSISYLLFLFGMLSITGGFLFGSFALYVATYSIIWTNSLLGLGFMVSGWVIGNYFLYKSPDFYGWKRID